MRYLYRLPLVAFLLAPALAQGGRLYQATFDQSSWRSRAEAGWCHLSHVVPLFGTATFSENTRGELRMSIETLRPPGEGGHAVLYSRSPEWQPAAERELESTRLYPEASTLRFSHFSAQRILSELEAGQLPIVKFAGWWNEGRIELGLSPVGFRQGLRAHQACIASLPSTLPSATAQTLASEPVSEGRFHNTELMLPVVAASGTASYPIVHIGMADLRPLSDLGYLQTVGAPEGTAPAPTEVYFATDNAGLSRVAMDTIRQFAEQLRQNPRWKAAISIGHTDVRGGDVHNARLAGRRAQAVQGYLHRLGIDKSRVVTRVTTERHAPPGTSDPYALAQDRRVVLQVEM